jgi:hypothetical protein
MSVQAWAEQTFGHAELGDQRRTRRLVAMARRSGLAPAGLVSSVFRIAAERQAAYDLLEHEQVCAEAVSNALFDATAHGCQGQPRVFIALDGASVGVHDATQSKGLGRIANFIDGVGLGLRVMNAYALNERGTPIGVADQIWWTRPLDTPVASRKYRPAKERESQRWREAVARVSGRFAARAPDSTLHFIADREADAALTIKALLRSGHEFTIRSNGKRKVRDGSRRLHLRSVLAQQKPLVRIKVRLPGRARRPSRIAILDVRAAQLPLILRDHHYGNRTVVKLTAVWAREVGGKGIDWILVTNVPVNSAVEACDAVGRYALRWRIEDFHRTWKSGLCGVESTQLRSRNAIIKWATILGAVASRAERLRHRYREEPNTAATSEFSSTEIEAIVFLKNEDKRGQRISADGLTMAMAVRWVADLGGYVGNRGSGPPGATTIARGLERVVFTAEILSKLRADGRLR